MEMALPNFFLFLACVLPSFLELVLHPVSADGDRYYKFSCPKSFYCAQVGPLYFPLFNSNSSQCGLYPVYCFEQQNVLPGINLGSAEFQYEVLEISSKDDGSSRVRVIDRQFKTLLNERNCTAFTTNFDLGDTLFVSFSIPDTLTMFRCYKSFLADEYFNYTGCRDDYFYYYKFPDRDNVSAPADFFDETSCSRFQLPRVI